MDVIRAVLRRSAIILVCAWTLCGCQGRRNASDVWMFATPRPIVLAGDSEVTTPVLKDGSAFFCAGYFWNGESELYSITTATGQPQWQVRVGSCPHDGPSLVGSTVIALANQEHGTQHVAFGVDASGRWSPTEGR